MSIDEKFKKDKLKFEVVRNKNLICKDCKYVLDDTEKLCNTSKCKIFDLKPNSVFNDNKCEEYLKKN